MPVAIGLGYQALGVKGQLFGIKHRSAHVHRDAAVGREFGFDHAFHGLHAQAAFAAQAALVHKLGKTACAIATLLHLRAIGVVDDVFEVNAGPWGRASRPYLIGAHAQVAVAQNAVMRGGEPQRAAGFVQHDKVVASTLHFGKRDSHRPDYQSTRLLPAKWPHAPIDPNY